MSLLHAILLGIVEGLTEFLPVSSTGHLIVTSHALGLDRPDTKDAVDAFEIVIQGAALLAVLVHYRRLLFDRARGLFTRDPLSLRLLSALVIGFVPLAAVGLLLGKTIKRALFGPAPVAVALLVGGLVMLAFPPLVRLLRTRGALPAEPLSGIEHVGPGRALAIGLGQCLALVPGTSRSMATILTGELTGLGTETAAEFSFLLSIPTLGAATCYELLKSWRVLFSALPPASLAAGMVVSFAVAWAVIAVFLRLLGRVGLAPFGAYRLVAAALVWYTLLR